MIFVATMGRKTVPHAHFSNVSFSRLPVFLPLADLLNAQIYGSTITRTLFDPTGASRGRVDDEAIDKHQTNTNSQRTGFAMDRSTRS